jgi:hypothetical protein
VDGFPEVIAGRYRLHRKLGEGGLGEVFEATDESLGRRLALKLIRSHGHDQAVTSRALAEYRSVAQLKSRHVAPVLDFGMDGDAIFIAQDFIDGEPLGKLVPLPLREALVVAGGIANALADAHENGFIHRDIKPSNVIVPRVGGALVYDEAKLLDFGVAGLLVEGERQGARTTVIGQFFGTPLYMSPEQWGGGRQGPATDVYGLGVLLFEMIFGRPPFVGQAPELIRAILSQPVQLPAEPALPPSVRDFLTRCLSKNMAERPGDGRAAERDLARLFRSSGFVMAGARATSDVAAASAAPARPASPSAAPVSAPLAVAPRTFPETVARSGMAAPAFEGTFAVPSVDFGRPTLAAGTRARSIWLWVVLAVASLAGAAALLLLVRRFEWIAVGFGGLAVSWGLALYVHRLIEKRRPPLGGAVAALLGRATALEDLTKSLALDVGRLVEACRQLDEQILAKTLALMIGEYDKAQASADRQAALMKAVELMERLKYRLSPWYVRHQALLSYSIGILGSALTTAKTAHAVWKLFR